MYTTPTFSFLNDSISLLFADVESEIIFTIQTTIKSFNRRKSNLELIDYRGKNHKYEDNLSKCCEIESIEQFYNFYDKLGSPIILMIMLWGLYLIWTYGGKSDVSKGVYLHKC